MLTQIGIFLRKLRLDEGEIMKDMAKKLEVSSSFLSAVENGKKRMPVSWIEEIPNLYSLNSEKIEEFRKAVANTEETVEIPLQNLSSTKREFAFSLARKLETINDEDLMKMINKFKENEE